MRWSSASSSIAIEWSEPSTVTSSTRTPAALRLSAKDSACESGMSSAVECLDRRRTRRSGDAPQVGELDGPERLGAGDGQVGRSAQLHDRGHPGVDGEVAAAARAEQGGEVSAGRAAEGRDAGRVEVEAVDLGGFAKPAHGLGDVVDRGREDIRGREAIVQRERHVTMRGKEAADAAVPLIRLVAPRPAAPVDDEDRGARCAVRFEGFARVQQCGAGAVGDVGQHVGIRLRGGPGRAFRPDREHLGRRRRTAREQGEPYRRHHQEGAESGCQATTRGHGASTVMRFSGKPAIVVRSALDTAVLCEHHLYVVRAGSPAHPLVRNSLRKTAPVEDCPGSRCACTRTRCARS